MPAATPAHDKRPLSWMNTRRRRQHVEVLETHSRLTGPIKDSWILPVSIKDMFPCMSDESRWTGQKKSFKFDADPV